ncbi:MAG: hypothetical protein AAF108_10700 [Planctomycetota bacterium]
MIQDPRAARYVRAIWDTAALSDNAVTPATLARRTASFLAVGGVSLLVAGFLGTNLILGFAIGITAGLAIEAAWSGLRGTPAVRPGAVARTLARHGFCGVCAYDLRPGSQSPSPDNTTPKRQPGPATLVCPECGAAWSIARLMSSPLPPEPRAGQPASRSSPRAPAPLAKEKGRVGNGRPLGLDDRGGLYRRFRASPLRAPEARHDWTDQQHNTMSEARRRHGRRVRLLLAMSLAACWGFVAWTAWHAVAGNPAFNTWAPLLIAPVTVALVIASAVAALLSDLGTSTDRWASDIRDAGVCPACAGTLDLSETDVEDFTVCAACGCSWKPQRPDAA